MEPTDYKNRTYLSAIEASKFLGITVEMLHNIVNQQLIKAQIAASGQMRFDLQAHPLQTLLEQPRYFVLPPRRTGLSFPREVKRSRSKFPTKKMPVRA